MKLKELKRKILRVTGNHLLSGSVNLLCRSLTINIVNGTSAGELENMNQNYVLAFWHSTMLVPWYLNRNKNYVGLTSKSKDGDLLARVLNKWNYCVVRGSSSSGGDEALNLMVDYARNKSSIAVTPDGPKGPARRMKAGAVIAAKRGNVPLLLLGVGYKKNRKLKSWDRFEIPKFFSRVNVVYSEPIYISSELSYEETSEMIQNCENKLNELQRTAEILE
jgi:lysophospholipid acyltransferase (LPLAT)-like uncharacterized protein